MIFCMFLTFALVSAEDYENINPSTPPPSYCYFEDQSPNLLFGSTTNYELAKSKYPLPPTPENCEIKAMWMLVRHGSSFPSAEELRSWEKMPEMRDAIVHNHKNKNMGELCEKDIATLESWYPSIDITKKNLLSKVGVAEAGRLGKEFTLAFREVFVNLSIPATVMYAHSNQKRSRDTAQIFIEAMKNAGCTAKIMYLGENPLLSLDQSCPKWSKLLKKQDYLKEVKNYKLQMHVKEMLREISHKLGFSFELSYDIIYRMYKLCSYETSISFENLSPWCAIFEKHHIKILQNEEDLYSYYSSGYGNKLTPKLGCPVVQHLFHSLSEVSKNTPDEPQINILFAHELNMRAVLTTLGIAWDSDPITAKNIESVPDRMWNTSQITPYMANLNVILYRCEDVFRVKFMLNNFLVQYTGCNISFCDWQFVQNGFEDMIDPLTCNYDFCAIEPSSFAKRFSYSKRIMLFTASLTICLKFILKH